MLGPSATPKPHEQAIGRIAFLIRESPDTSGGVQLRRFLWSLYNMHHLVNLWELASRLSGEPAELVITVLRAALLGELNENDVKRGLLVSGETERWDSERIRPGVAELLDQAEQDVSGAIRHPQDATQSGAYRFGGR